MAKELSQKLGEMTYDGLITDLDPKVIVGGGVIAKGAEATTVKHGTILSKDAKSGNLAVMKAGATPDCVLAEDVEVGTDEDANVVVYIAGCFDPDKCIVADGYNLSTADRDTLRTKNIYFKSPAEA